FRSQLSFARYDLLHQDALTDRVLILEVETLHRFIDHGHGRSAFCVVLTEGPALPQGHSEGPEIRRADHFEKAPAAVGAIDDGLVRPLKRHAVTPALHWKSRRQRNIPHAGQGFDIGDDLAQIGVQLLWIGKFLVGYGEPGSEDIRGIEARVYLLHLKEAANQQTCAGEQDE